SDIYVDAAETGVGVFEMPDDKAGAAQREFQPIAQWVLGDAEAAAAALLAPAPVEPVYDASNVVQLAAARASAPPYCLVYAARAVERSAGISARTFTERRHRRRRAAKSAS